MTSHTGRLYAVAVALVVFFLTWAAVAARPWASAQADPRLAALAARERRARHESLVVRRIVRHRWAVYRVQLKHRQAQIAAARRGCPAGGCPAGADSRGSSPAGACRDPAAADGDADVVIENAVLVAQDGTCHLAGGLA
jgi:hypothetical protein